MDLKTSLACTKVSLYGATFTWGKVGSKISAALSLFDGSRARAACQLLRWLRQSEETWLIYSWRLVAAKSSPSLLAAKSSRSLFTRVSSTKRPSILLVFVTLGFLFSNGARSEVLFDGEWDGFGGRFQCNNCAPQWLADIFQWFAGSMSNHWETVQEKELGLITPVLDPTSPKHGVVARIEVRPGDIVKGSERAEVAHMMRQEAVTGKTVSFPVTESDGHEFYGIAVKLPSDWRSPGKNHGTGAVWGTFLQLHGPTILGAPPPIELDAEDDFQLGMCNGDVLEGGTRQVPKDGRTYSFTNGDLKPGQWVQFMLDVTWSYSDNGHIAIYRRDEGEKNFSKVLDLSNIATLQYKFGASKNEGQHYWKTGFYRSSTEGFTSVVWLGPLVRGTSFNDVAKAAFGTP